MMTEEREKLKVGFTFAIGLAFFTTGVPWSLYNTQVNQQLILYLGSIALVGVLMAVDNIIGVIIQPIMGSVSDNTRTRWGRRMPYIFIGVIASAIFFALIPTGFSPITDVQFYRFWLLLIWILLFSTSMGFYRSQAVALMPDFTRPYNRSKANAIINLMGGVGAVIAYTLSLLSDYIGLQLAFILGSVFMIIALIILIFTVKERDAYTYRMILDTEKEGKDPSEIQSKVKKPGLIESLKTIATEKDKSTLFILLAILAWFIGYQGAEALFSIYAGPEGIIGVTPGFAGFLFQFVAIPFILFAVPAGLIATRIGRRLAIKIGLGIMIVVMMFAFLAQANLLIVIIMLVLFGMGWALVNVNSIVIVWELAPSSEKIGTYTGVYYFFSVLAAIIGPPLVGLFTQLIGLFTLLAVISIFFVIALIFMFFVRRGEVELTEEEKLERQKVIQEL